MCWSCAHSWKCASVHRPRMRWYQHYKCEYVNCLININLPKNKAWLWTRLKSVSSGVLHVNHRQSPRCWGSCELLVRARFFSPAIRKRILAAQTLSLSRILMAHRTTQIKRILQSKAKSSQEKADFKEVQLEPKHPSSRALLPSDTPVFSASKSRTSLHDWIKNWRLNLTHNLLTPRPCLSSFERKRITATQQPNPNFSSRQCARLIIRRTSWGEFACTVIRHSVN